VKRFLSAAAIIFSLLIAFGCGGVRPPAPPAVFPLKPLWTTPVGDFVEGSLATDGRRLFVMTRGGLVRALDPATGEVLWQSEQRTGAVAAAEGGLIVRLVDGTVRSLAPAKGNVRWEAASGIVGDIAPVLDGDRILVAGKGLAALDLATGRVLWSAPADPTVTSPPVSAGSRLLTGEQDGTLRCRDRASGVSLWTLRTGAPLVAPPLFDAERRRLYLGTTDRRILEVDLEKGELGWTWKVGAAIESPGLLHEHRVIFAGFDAVLYAQNRGNGNLVWRAALPSRPMSGPLLSGASILVACHENDLVGLSTKTGKPVGSLRTAARIGTPPLVLGGKLFLGLRDRTVVAFELAGFAAPVEAAPPPTSLLTTTGAPVN
jgi:outer membrane protein assembly factor BamB